MRDIIYLPVQSEGTARSAHVDAAKLPSPTSSHTNKLDRFLDWLNNTTGFVVGLFDSNTRHTFQVSNADAPASVRYVVQPTKKLAHRAHVASRIVFDKTKQSASHHAKHLKTPLGKVAVINLVAIIALFSYIQIQQKPAASEAASLAPQVAKQPVQRYLPVVPNVAQSTPFDETSVTQTLHHTKLFVWATPWNLGQITATKASYASFSAFWATVNQDGSTIELKGSLDSWKTFASTSIQGQPTFLTISGDPTYTSLILTSATTQQTFLTNALKLVQAYNFTGLDLDFEGLGSTNKDLFTSFVRNAATVLHGEGKQLSVTLEARIANQVPMDWHAVGLLADEVRIMAYDYHSRLTDQPGPVGPLGWVKEVADYAIQNIDRNKIVMGLGNYGYDWQAPATPTDSWTGTGLSYEQAQALLTQYKTPLLHSSGIDSRGYDTGTIPYFTYQDAQGNQHQVWFEDSASLQEKVNLLDQYSLKGIIFWSVGMGDQAFWTQQNSLTYTKTAN